MRIRTRSRTGFTLMELLVSTALILFIMAIISQMFGSGSKIFTALRTNAQLQSNARSGINIIRKDLAQEHFEGPYHRGGPNLGDQRLDLAGWRPPRAGYFEIFQGIPSGYEPGPPLGFLPDGEGNYSTRANTHSLKFTIRLPDVNAAELNCALYHPRLAQNGDVNAYRVFAPLLYARWAEVHYFLVQTGSTNGGSPVFSLRRRVRLLPPKTVDILLSQAEVAQIAADMSSQKYPDVISPIISAAPSPPYPPNSFFAKVPGPELLNIVAGSRIPSGVVHPTGDDILLTDVISFEVKAAWIYNPIFNSFTANSSSVPYFANPDFNTDEPFSDLRPSTLRPSAGRHFDTGYQTDNIDWDNPAPASSGFLWANPANPIPSRINIRALQIKIRLWDPRAEQARQITIIQEV